MSPQVRKKGEKMGLISKIKQKLKHRQLKKQLKALPPMERGKLRFMTRYADKNYQYGYGSYGTPEVYDWNEGHRLIIGKFCSIASEVKILITGSHPTHWITTYPFCIFLKGIKSSPLEEKDVVIGNDVWLATGTTILGGVTIGDGAAVVGYAVVTKDVPPYAIVGGNPAKIIRYRFSEETIKALLTNPWWDLPIEEIKQIAPLLSSNKVDDLIAYMKNRLQ